MVVGSTPTGPNMNNKTRKARLEKAKAEWYAIKKHLDVKCKEIDTLILECPHDEYTRTADPSGGHDHAYTCKTCSKEW